jgi:hypothetical protein
MQLTAAKGAARRSMREGVTVTPLKMEGAKGALLLRS